MRILIISKSYAPSISSQALQIEKVAKAICGAGCEVKVIAGYSGQGNISGSEPCEVHYVPHVVNKSNSQLLDRIASRVYLEVSNINPTGKWVVQAYEKALELCKTFRPDIILTSSTPFESHLIGLRLYEKFKIKWIASFSDPWPAKMSPAPYSNGNIPFFSFLQSYWLKKVLARCDAIHMTTQYANEIVANRIDSDLSRKMWTIQHIGTEPPPSDKVVKHGWLYHIGHFTRERVSFELIRAIDKLADDPTSSLQGMITVGDICPELTALRKKMGMEEKIRMVGRVSHDEALSYALEAHCLLVCEADMEMSPFLPSKFADYAMVGRPILALTPLVSAMRDYLTKYGGGLPVGFSQDEIEKKLQYIFKEQNDANGFSNSVDLKHVFSAKVVGERYKEMFESLV